MRAVIEYNFRNTSFKNMGVEESKYDLENEPNTSEKLIKNTKKII